MLSLIRLIWYAFFAFSAAAVGAAVGAVVGSAVLEREGSTLVFVAH